MNQCCAHDLLILIISFFMLTGVLVVSSSLRLKKSFNGLCQAERVLYPVPFAD